MVNRSRTAFTLVELLVVIAIIGILVALLLPAIQAAREAARRSQCVNQLKQLATGCLNHESSLKYFPTGGWGWDFVGDADAGYGLDQPGGWMYNILPFIEENVKHDLPKDGDRTKLLQPQLDGARQMLLDPIKIIKCPTRGNPLVGPTVKKNRFANNSALNPQPTFSAVVGHSDYAANAGDISIGGGTGSLEPPLTIGHLGRFYPDPSNGYYDASKPLRGFNGISFQHSQVGIRNIPDGTTKTYLCGEKYLDPKKWEDFQDPDTGNNETWCTGHNNDNFRTAADSPRMDGTPNPADGSTEDGNIFGSAHGSAWNVAFCDGHIESISYDIDINVHRNNANRADGNVNAN